MLDERNVFQAFTRHSKDVQGKPQGGSTTSRGLLLGGQTRQSLSATMS